VDVVKSELQHKLKAEILYYTTLTRISHLLQVITSSPQAVKLSWLENAYSHPLFSGGDFDLEIRSFHTGFWFVVMAHQ